MRRVAILFAMLAAVNTVEHIALSGKFCSGFTRAAEAPRRIRRALITLSDWRAYLIGPFQLLQRQSN